MINYLIFLIFHLLISVSFATDANELPPAEVFGKCYEKLTDMPVDISSATYKNIEAGKSDPVAACMAVLSKATFKQTGGTRSLPVIDPVSVSILRNFHQFHLSWFGGGALGGPLGVFNYQFNDNDEPGLYITDALFSDKPFSSITQSSESLRGMRQTDAPSSYYVENLDLTNRRMVMGPVVLPSTSIEENFSELKGARVPVGPLVGISTAPEVNFPLAANLGKDPLLDANLTSRAYEGTTLNVTQAAGGGIIGSFPLLQNNMESNTKQDGGLYVHRRWASNFVTNILCSKLPSLMNDDAPVQRELAMYAKSNLSFRRAATCLACHTTLDNFAHVTRNMDVQLSMGFADVRDLLLAIPDKGYAAMPLAMTHKVRSPASALNDSDNLYIRRPPEGRLTFRDYNNVLVDEAVVGVQGMGDALAKREDMYVCAAKRYYYFLTGVDIPLTPIEIDSSTKKNKYASDNFNFYHREQIVSLGKALKKDGSLKNLVQNILKTPTFKARNPAQVGDQ